MSDYVVFNEINPFVVCFKMFLFIRPSQKDTNFNPYCKLYTANHVYCIHIVKRARCTFK